MNELTIGYKKKHLNFNLVFGLIWLGTGTLSFLWLESRDWINYGYFVLGFLYILMFYFKAQYKYITISNNFIKLNQPFGWQVECREILNIRKFGGDYIIKTQNKEYTISGELIDPKMVVPLDEALHNLHLKWS